MFQPIWQRSPQPSASRVSKIKYKLTTTDKACLVAKLTEPIQPFEQAAIGRCELAVIEVEEEGDYYRCKMATPLLDRLSWYIHKSHVLALEELSDELRS